MTAEGRAALSRTDILRVVGSAASVGAARRAFLRGFGSRDSGTRECFASASSGGGPVSRGPGRVKAAVLAVEGRPFAGPAWVGRRNARRRRRRRNAADLVVAMVTGGSAGAGARPRVPACSALLAGRGSARGRARGGSRAGSGVCARRSRADGIGVEGWMAEGCVPSGCSARQRGEPGFLCSPEPLGGRRACLAPLPPGVTGV